MAKIADKVKILISSMKGKTGRVVGIGKNPALPVAVKFDDSETEWDYKHEELEVLK